MLNIGRVSAAVIYLFNFIARKSKHGYAEDRRYIYIFLICNEPLKRFIPK